MLKNLILSAAAAGVAAGLLTAVIQHVTTTPIILEAERYEDTGHRHNAVAASHEHEAGTPVQEHAPAAAAELAMSEAAPAAPDYGEEEEWIPADGLERTFYTSLATTVIAVGFALALLGAMVVAGIQIDARSGLAFGAGGFVAVTLAPALGLPPEIPGSGAAALETRQLWWFFAVAATAAGLAGLLLTRRVGLQIAGVALIALPHLVGAPHPPELVSTAPAELAGHFAATSLAVTAIFWAVLGYASGAFYEHLSRSG
jgi:cobalt transporter subunit CbtA